MRLPAILSHGFVIGPIESFKRVSSRQFVAGSVHKTFERLDEPCEGKLSSTVLRGGANGNVGSPLGIRKDQLFRRTLRTG